MVSRLKHQQIGRCPRSWMSELCGCRALRAHDQAGCVKAAWRLRWACPSCRHVGQHVHGPAPAQRMEQHLRRRPWCPLDRATLTLLALGRSLLAGGPRTAKVRRETETRADWLAMRAGHGSPQAIEFRAGQPQQEACLRKLMASFFVCILQIDHDQNTITGRLHTQACAARSQTKKKEAMTESNTKNNQTHQRDAVSMSRTMLFEQVTKDRIRGDRCTSQVTCSPEPS